MKGGLIGMTWLRKRLRGGARRALFALAAQFALSFGHFHGDTAQAAPAFQTGAVQGDIVGTGSDAALRKAAQQPPPPNHDGDQPADNCAICAVVAMANAVLQSPPPLLRLPQALEFLYRATDAEFIHLKSVGDTLQPPAAPAS